MSTATMRAARMHGNRDIRIDSVPRPQLSPGKALVEIEYCGICGSDLHEYLEGPKGIPLPTQPHSLTGETLPSILGHEFCGTVHATNPDSALRVGQKVMVDPRLNCKSCRACTSAHDHQCPQFGFLGYSGFGGGFSELCPVEESMLHVLPDGVGLDCASLIEPLAVALHAVKMSGLRGDLGAGGASGAAGEKSVLVVGGGPVGYAVILALRAEGVTKVILSEPTRTRREQTGTLVEVVIDPTKEKVGERCRAVTGGVGVDMAFDCAGVQRGLDDAFDALADGGQWVNVSLWDGNMTLPYWLFMKKELKLTTSFCYNAEDYKEVMVMIGEGKFKGYEKMVTSRIHLEDVVSKGFKALTENKDDHVKILVTPKRENIG